MSIICSWAPYVLSWSLSQLWGPREGHPGQPTWRGDICNTLGLNWGDVSPNDWLKSFIDCRSYSGRNWSSLVIYIGKLFKPCYFTKGWVTLYMWKEERVRQRGRSRGKAQITTLGSSNISGPALGVSAVVVGAHLAPLSCSTYKQAPTSSSGFMC